MGYVEFPPFYSTTAEGKPQGSFIDLAIDLAKRSGYKILPVSLPPNRMTSSLVRGNIDLWIGLPTYPQFQNHTYIGDAEVGQITLQAYSLGNAAPIKSFTDLNNKSVILIHGYNYGGWIAYLQDPENSIRIEYAQKRENGLEMLLNNRATYLLDYEKPMRELLLSTNIENLHPHPLCTFKCHIVVSAKREDAQTLLKTLEANYLGR